jgi:hypothetical protein
MAAPKKETNNHQGYIRMLLELMNRAVVSDETETLWHCQPGIFLVVTIS